MSIMSCPSCETTTADGLVILPSGKIKAHKDAGQPCPGGKPVPYTPEPVEITTKAATTQGECAECGEEHPKLKTPGKVRKHVNPQTLATCEQRPSVEADCPKCQARRTLKKMRLPVHNDPKTRSRCRASNLTMTEASKIEADNPTKPATPKPKPAPKAKAPKVVLTPVQQAVKKATALGEELKLYPDPWSFKVLTGQSDQDENQATLVLNRGKGDNKEEMRISWWGAACLGGEGRITHTFRNRTIAIRNANAIRDRGRIPHDEIQAEYNRVATRKIAGAAKPKAQKTIEQKRELLPFDPAKATDDEILAAVLGKNIVWENKTADKTEKDVVKSKPTIKKTNTGERNLTFKGINSTRTVRVGNLVSVS